ncbi:MAG: hypothetical protein JO316_22005 [Abitibacteriaceae bacterium]|nr:hypothetical protein [Abditibacteriaceae bacterium]
MMKPALPLALLAVAQCQIMAQAKPSSQGIKTSQLIGTWRVVSLKYGRMTNFKPWPQTSVMLKHITPSHWSMVTYDAKSGQVTRVAGGTYLLKGNVYQENVQYGLGRDIKGLIGKPQIFNDQVTATRWHHTGRLSQGERIEELWVRVR